MRTIYLNCAHNILFCAHTILFCAHNLFKLCAQYNIFSLHVPTGAPYIINKICLLDYLFDKNKILFWSLTCTYIKFQEWITSKEHTLFIGLTLMYVSI